MNADALGAVVVHGDEHRGRGATDSRSPPETFSCPRCSHVRPPHGVHRVRDDRAVVVARTPRRSDAPSRPCSRISLSTRRLEVRTPACRSRARGAVRATPCDGPRRERGWRRGGRGRAPPTPHPPSARSSLGAAAVRYAPARGGVKSGTRSPLHAADTRDAIRLAVAGRSGPAHGRDRLRAKGLGPRASRTAILASSNSRSSSISPSLAFSRSLSNASPSSPSYSPA